MSHEILSPTETTAGTPAGKSPEEIAAVCDTLEAAVLERLRGQVLPESTYRLQFNKSFTFKDATAVVPYLAQLGITHVYASPYLKARTGSQHGYDIVDHSQLNPEVGTPEEFQEFVAALHASGLQQILDVVPNHMGVAGDENPWWMDVLENGPSSPYARFFDIDWMPLKPDLAHKVLIPVLGDQFGHVLEKQELQVQFEDGGFRLRYWETRFPLAPRSWTLLLDHDLPALQERLGEEDPDCQEYHSILTALRNLPAREETEPARVLERMREKEVIRRRLRTLSSTRSEVLEFIEENVRLFNGTLGDPRSFDRLEQLLQDQAYRLCYWRVAADEINYRRFFDINDLAAICMERPEVFEATHRLVFQMLGAGQLAGLRIDHADGLYDPEEYLSRVQATRFLQLCREAAGEELAADWPQVEAELLRRYDALRLADPASPLVRPLYLVVEKILEHGERLPPHWPIHGTTGYEFLNVINGLFVDRANGKRLERLYAQFLHRQIDYHELVYRCKRLIVRISMASEIAVLGHQLDRISERNRRSQDFTLNSLTDAIREIIACFPVYRTYSGVRGVTDGDRRYVEQAVARARYRNPALSAATFQFIRDTLLLKYPPEATPADEAALREFVYRFQQVTGPIMAKGLEDTAFYVYHRLVALNEVGGSPELFGTSVEEFHAENQEQQAQQPHSMLASSTHDTKRSEDVRARIDTISEMPDLWKRAVARWRRWNQKHKSEVEGEIAPTRNDEYLFYQTLIGAWPLAGIAGEARSSFVERMQRYMIKAAREAKRHSSWINPNEPYEAALHSFVDLALADTPRNKFRNDVEKLALRAAQYGIWNSLAQTVLKLTSPGVPDTYQGTEIWSYTLVDPDNRQPVDYAIRRQLLEDLQQPLAHDPAELIRQLVAEPQDGRLKLFAITTLLNYRRSQPGLFTTGDYLPLEASGEKAEHLCTFARKSGETTVIVAVPRLIVRLTGETPAAPLGEALWGETQLTLPENLTSWSWRNLLTGETIIPAAASLRAADLFRNLPVAVLESSGVSDKVP